MNHSISLNMPLKDSTTIHYPNNRKTLTRTWEANQSNMSTKKNYGNTNRDASQIMRNKRTNATENDFNIKQQPMSFTNISKNSIVQLQAIQRARKGYRLPKKVIPKLAMSSFKIFTRDSYGDTWNGNDLVLKHENNKDIYLNGNNEGSSYTITHTHNGRNWFLVGVFTGDSGTYNISRGNIGTWFEEVQILITDSDFDDNTISNITISNAPYNSMNGVILYIRMPFSSNFVIT